MANIYDFLMASKYQICWDLNYALAAKFDNANFYFFTLTNNLFLLLCCAF